jgi:AraC-like DNA-binding protein
MALIQQIIDFWTCDVKKYFYKYRKGFYEVVIIANSPDILIKNIIAMPFVKFDKARQIGRTNNPFTNVTFFYLQLEEELKLMVAAPFYKKNVIENLVYYEGEPVNYFLLSLRRSENKLKSQHSRVNGTVFSSDMWCLSKPRGANQFCHFKDTEEYFIAIYFTKDWLNTYLLNASPEVRLFFEKFISAEASFVLWPTPKHVDDSEYSLLKNIFVDKRLIKEMNISDYKAEVIKLIEHFTHSVQEFGPNKEVFNMSNEQRISTLKAENILSHYYVSEFPGIDFIANNVGMSETALKTGFKLLFGSSVFKYYRKRKMEIAFDVLKKNKDLQVKELALQMGYENASKFAIAFREEMGIAPSEVDSL